jgi:Protein of unknown function (DUF3592)
MQFKDSVFGLGRLRWRGVPLLIGAICLVGVVARPAIELVQLSRLRHEGRNTRATVLDRNVGGSKRIRMTYEFVPNGSQVAFRGLDQIDISTRSEWEQSLALKQIDIRYLPNDPAVSRVASTVHDRVISNRVSIVVFGVGALLLGVGGIVASTMSRTEFERWWFAG